MSVRMTVNKKMKDKCWRGCGDCAVGGNVTSTAIRESSMVFPQIVENTTTFDLQSHIWVCVQKK